MSYQATTWVIDAWPGMSAGEWRVLIVLARYADARGENARPKPETIAAHLGIHPRTVQRALHSLQHGMPPVIERTGVTRRGVFVYRLLMTPDATPRVASTPPDKSLEKSGSGPQASRRDLP